MPWPTRPQRRRRLTAQATGVGNSYVEVSIANAPARGLVHRVRALVTGGTGTVTAIDIEVREATGATGLAVPLSVTGAPSPADVSLHPPVYYELDGTAVVGTLIVAVRTDHTTADHVVDLIVEVEGTA